MVPVAPARFSMRTVVFHISCSFCPITRARMSVPPPGAKPTMMRIGPPGRVCALSMGDARAAAAPAATKVRRFMGVSFGLVLLLLLLDESGSGCHLHGHRGGV